MTNKYAKAHPLDRTRGFCNMRVFMSIFMSLFILILFFKSSESAALWVSEGLTLCVRRLIPSLFPFIALSSLIASSGLGTVFGRILRAPFNALFGIGGEGACAVILGWLCGFPVGAKCACELYGDSKLTSAEYKRILCICGTPSPAFLVGTVGEAMLGSQQSGVWLYVLSIVSAAAVGIALRLLGGDASAPQTDVAGICSTSEHVSFARSLTRAISDSAGGMLCICAFVVFFSAFLGVLESSLSFLDLSEASDCLLFSFFELTSGLSRICSSRLPHAFPICALSVGWSGLSVHFQTMAICGDRSPSFSLYILCHLIRALLCFILAFVANTFLAI
ncbi:MAG: hypothetical protein J6B72_03835 [Clostridia bacterium]|nr:hypothetical protein [Clostridia bacterium]